MTRNELAKHHIHIIINKRSWVVKYFTQTVASGPIQYGAYNVRNIARQQALDAAHTVFVKHRMDGSTFDVTKMADREIRKFITKAGILNLNSHNGIVFVETVDDITPIP